MAAGAICLLLGWAADRFSVCPSVKRIWTPSWTLFSGGWCLLGMAAFHLAADIAGLRRVFFPLVVIGMNSIALYVLTHSFAEFISDVFETHLGRGPFLWAGEAFEPLLHGLCVVTVLWLIAWWMHRRRLYLRI